MDSEERAKKKETNSR